MEVENFFVERMRRMRIVLSKLFKFGLFERKIAVHNK